MNTYEGMFLLDNQVVREDWGQAKAVVTDTLAKHGAEVVTARRWDERKLAYPIRTKKRATYLLTYFKADGDVGPGLRRELELDERVLRYLLLRREEVPAAELELSQAELAADFVVPAPPQDDEPVVEAAAPKAEEKPSDEDSDDEDSNDDDGEGESARKKPTKKKPADEEEDD